MRSEDQLQSFSACGGRIALESIDFGNELSKIHRLRRFPLCVSLRKRFSFSKENPPLAVFPLCFPKEHDQIFKKIAPPAVYSFVFP